jgi:hypothetical protein
VRGAQLRVDDERAFGDIAIRVFQKLDLPVAAALSTGSGARADQTVARTACIVDRRFSLSTSSLRPDRLLAQQRKDAFQSRETPTDGDKSGIGWVRSPEYISGS